MPTQEQSIFIFTHYPTDSAPSQMIAKIYQLWQEAKNAEIADEAAKNAYNKPAGRGRKEQEVEVYEEVLLDEEDTTFGTGVAKQNKKAGKQQDKRQAEAKQQKPKV